MKITNENEKQNKGLWLLNKHSQTYIYASYIGRHGWNNSELW